MVKWQNPILNDCSLYYVQIEFSMDRSKSWKTSQEMTRVIQMKDEVWTLV